jgi:uncharacterized protein with NAD-binding domain and iron-sulfur cluster
MRAAYEELKRPASHPLATLEDAFKGCDEIVLCDRQGSGWTTFAMLAPPNNQKPGTGLALPSFWEIALSLSDWALSRLRELPAEAGGALDPATNGEQELVEAKSQAEGGHGTPSGEAGDWLLKFFVEKLCKSRDKLWEDVVRARYQADPHLRLFFTMYDTFVSAADGVVNDGVLEHGWSAINELELCEWLASHGAKEVTLGHTPAERCPLLRSIYDVAFGYPEGKIANANVAAGTAMNDLLRLCFSYRGSIMYKMQAGMGDTVFTPFYEVLKRRGVKFEFFHAATRLHLSPAQQGNYVQAIDLVPQVELTVPEYSPLVISRELECWPSEPDWGQLKDGAQLKQQGVNFELEANPLGVEEVTLTRGVDFDAVVLGIPVGGLGPICAEIAERCPPFKRMLESAVTVSTQAFQLWLTRTIAELGWAHDENSVVGCYEEPIDTWCDMTHLKEREAWPASASVNGLAYFCGVMEDRDGESNAEATKRVGEGAQAFLEGKIAPLWPRSIGSNGEFDWTALVDLEQRVGAARFQAQYWRANTTPSERYVLTPANSVKDRLGADESGVENLVLAGDWTRNGIDGGCVEAAMTSGMQAARALIGESNPITGESDTWLQAGTPKPASGEVAG